MKTYHISTRPIGQTITAKDKQEAIEIFWENFDTYNEMYPDTEDLIVKQVKNEENEPSA